jgi:protein TonB
MFDTVTAVSPWEVPAARRTRIIGGAFAIHAAAAAIYLFAAVWTIRPVAAPDLLDVFTREYVPPVVTFEGPAKTADKKASQAGPVSASTRDLPPADAQPTAIAELAPAGDLETIPSPGIAAFGASGDARALAAAGTGDGEASITYHSGMAPPRVLFRTKPLYPELARRLRKQGTVVIEAEIGRDGLLRTARAVNPPLGFGLEEAALSALADWRFAPALLNERPVSVFYRLSVTFTLQ